MKIFRFDIQNQKMSWGKNVTLHGTLLLSTIIGGIFVEIYRKIIHNYLLSN